MPSLVRLIIIEFERPHINPSVKIKDGGFCHAGEDVVLNCAAERGVFRIFVANVYANGGSAGGKGVVAHGYFAVGRADVQRKRVSAEGAAAHTQFTEIFIRGDGDGVLCSLLFIFAVFPVL